MKARSYSAVFVFIIAANIPLWVASHLLGFQVTGLFNIELVALGIVSIFLGRTATLGLFLIGPVAGHIVRCRQDLHDESIGADSERPISGRISTFSS